MQLKEWKHKEGRKGRWIAEKLGLPVHRVHRLINGAPPKLSEVVQIQELTGFEVTINDFLRKPLK